MTEHPMVECDWCGVEFEFKAKGRGGQTRRYCKPSHRQRAYEAKHGLNKNGKPKGKGRWAK